MSYGSAEIPFSRSRHGQPRTEFPSIDKITCQSGGIREQAAIANIRTLRMGNGSLFALIHKIFIFHSDCFQVARIK